MLTFHNLLSGPFLKIAELSKTVIRKLDEWPGHVQCSAIICLMKMMAASDYHATSSAPLLFSTFMQTKSSSVEQSILACFPDLLVRHPNAIEPWTNCIFEKIQNASDKMKTLCLEVISDLASKNLIKVN